MLRQLVEEIGESCNLTALSGSEVVYLDRVETAAPLRFYLHPGSRVPAHCSASGKLFLAQMSPAQRRRLLGHVPLEAYTPKTLTDARRAGGRGRTRQARRLCLRQRGVPARPAVLAVLVPSPRGRSNLAIALQAPVMRLTADKALQLLPALQRAAAGAGRHRRRRAARP